MPLRVLSLYRPALPGLRAQTIQVIHAAHALAARGHAVTLMADRGLGGLESAAEALASFGLAPLPTLDLQIAPSGHPGLAGLWYRARVLAWALGPPGVVVARDRRRLVAALPWLRRHRIALEVHGLGSALALEMGEPTGAHLRVERRAAKAASCMLANCEGTLAAWEDAHGELLSGPRGVVHNATSPSRRREARAPSPVLRVVGSLRGYKGLDLLVRAAPLLPCPLEMVGGSEAELRALGALPPGVMARRPVPYVEVPDLLADSAALILPLADNLFGARLTSPLKLWDYLATAAPVVAPDLPSVRAIAARVPAPLHLFRPGDPEDLAATVRRALAAPPRAPFVRSWAERAAEVEALIA